MDSSKSKVKKPFSSSENHSYNVNVAICLKHTGKATLLKEFYRSFKYWETHETNEKDGFHWFFLRMDKLGKLYPEYNSKSMYRWIKDLESLWLISSRTDMNHHGYDKTRWFTVNENAYLQLTNGNNKVLTCSQNENTGQFSKWSIAILKMRNAILKMGCSISQNETTIQSSTNPQVKSSTNPQVKNGKNNFSKHSFFEVVKEPQKKESLKPKKGRGKGEKNSAKKEETKQQAITDAVGIINFFNMHAERSVSAAITGRGSNNVSMIIKLLKDYSREEIELMIIYKCFEWKDNPKMRIYLDPDTLFGRKKSKSYIEKAIEMKNNPSFARVLRAAKQSETGGNINASQIVKMKNDLFPGYTPGVQNKMF